MIALHFNQNFGTDPVFTEFDLTKYNELKASYDHMLGLFKRHLEKLNLDDVKDFLSTVMDDERFKSCSTPDEVTDRLRSQIHMYRISPIQHTVEKFSEPDFEMRQAIKSYQREKDQFLHGTRIVKFQATLQPAGLPECMCEVQFIVTKVTAREKTMKEIDTLAQESLGSCYNKLSEMIRHPSLQHESVTWTIPKIYALDIILWAMAHLADLKEHGVKEVMVGRLKLSSCFQMQHQVSNSLIDLLTS